MKFIVDRTKWYRGQGVEKSRLLRQDGLRCCIGFVAQQCGVPDIELLHRPAVHNLDKYGKSVPLEGNLPAWFLTDATVGDLQDAYYTNDRLSLSPEDREAELKTIFAKHGDEIEFIN